jgi:hypothetical protein
MPFLKQVLCRYLSSFDRNITRTILYQNIKIREMNRYFGLLCACAVYITDSLHTHSGRVAVNTSHTADSANATPSGVSVISALFRSRFAVITMPHASNFYINV